MFLGSEANPIGTCVQNMRPNSNGSATVLHFEFHSFPQPVAFPLVTPADATLDYPIPSPTEESRILKIISYGLFSLFLSLDQKKKKKKKKKKLFLIFLMIKHKQIRLRS